MAEAFHPSVFISDELEARGWSKEMLAIAMTGDIDRNILMLDLYMEVGPERPNMRIGKTLSKKLSHAFGTSQQFWLNLEAEWLKRAERMG